MAPVPSTVSASVGPFELARSRLEQLEISQHVRLGHRECRDNAAKKRALSEGVHGVRSWVERLPRSAAGVWNVEEEGSPCTCRRDESMCEERWDRYHEDGEGGEGDDIMVWFVLAQSRGVVDFRKSTAEANLLQE
jgi:hypothetical protein